MNCVLTRARVEEGGDVRVFMSTDLEGATGVFSVSHISPDRRLYADACELLRGDVEAALDGCLAAGADEIVVADGHLVGENLSIRGFSDRVVLRSGYPGPHSWMSGVGPGFDAAVFVGYHARAGTLGAILDHTYFYGIYSLELEGVGEIGEFGLAAALCGAYGIPVVFVSGDAALAREAAEVVPGIRTVAVKDGLSRTGGLLSSPERTRVQIRESVCEALKGDSWPSPLDWSGRSLRATFTMSGLGDAAAASPGVVRQDGRAVSIQGSDYLETFARFLGCMNAVEMMIGYAPI
jgi:D-amino peptidase